ncbi:unnamed protein product, partial [Amoebophrya sp. A120]
SGRPADPNAVPRHGRRPTVGGGGVPARPSIGRGEQRLKGRRSRSPSQEVLEATTATAHDFYTTSPVESDREDEAHDSSASIAGAESVDGPYDFYDVGDKQGHRSRSLSPAPVSVGGASTAVGSQAVSYVTSTVGSWPYVGGSSSNPGTTSASMMGSPELGRISYSNPPSAKASPELGRNITTTSGSRPEPEQILDISEAESEAEDGDKQGRLRSLSPAAASTVAGSMAVSHVTGASSSAATATGTFMTGSPDLGRISYSNPQSAVGSPDLGRNTTTSGSRPDEPMPALRLHAAASGSRPEPMLRPREADLNPVPIHGAQQQQQQPNLQAGQTGNIVQQHPPVLVAPPGSSSAGSGSIPILVPIR